MPPPPSQGPTDIPVGTPIATFGDSREAAERTVAQAAARHTVLPGAGAGPDAGATSTSSPGSGSSASRGEGPQARGRAAVGSMPPREGAQPGAAAWLPTSNVYDQGQPQVRVLEWQSYLKAGTQGRKCMG